MSVSDRAGRGNWVQVTIHITLLTFAFIISPRALSDDLSPTSTFSIPSQPIRDALIEFSRQANVQVLGSSIDFGELQSAEVEGKFSGRRALKTLLGTTGLRYQSLRHSVVVTFPGITDTKGTRTIDIGPPILSPELDEDGARKEFPEPLGEMTVTGTHIRGGNAVGSRVIALSRDDIDQTGYSTVQDVIRSLPQNFGGGPSEDTNLGNEGNTSRGTGLNLRGLGAGSTLILVNGHRLPSAGSQAAFVDVSNIPLAAVSRIEMLTDGASAIYGSDPVGGVINFIMREDYQGAQTLASTGGVTEGGLREWNVSQLLGTRWDTGHLTFSFEFYDRGALPASERRQTANSDLRNQGGDNFSTRQTNPGTVQIGTQQYSIPHGQDGMGLSPTSFVPGATDWHDLNGERDLYGNVKRYSGYLSASQSIGDSIKVFADVLYASRRNHSRQASLTTTLTLPVGNPFRVLPAGASTTDSYRVLYDFGADLGDRYFVPAVRTTAAALNFNFDIGDDWDITWAPSYASEHVDQVQTGNFNASALSAALADQNPDSAFNPFGDTNPRTLASIRRSTQYQSDSFLTGMNLIANGGLFSLPGGTARLAIGADYRQERFRSRALGPNSTEFRISPTYSRDASAVFAEALLPITSPKNRIPGIHLLQLSLAARYDDYSDLDGVLNPRFGVEWSPISSVSLHGNWGKSFKAPNAPSLDQSGNLSYISLVPDPQSASGVSSVLTVAGGNAGLSPETATTWTAGIKWSPDLQSHPTFDISYFDIAFRDRIQTPPYLDRILTDPVRYAGILNRLPTPSQRAEICSQSQFVGNFGTTSGTCVTAPIAAIIDGRFANTSTTTTRGIEFEGTWDFETSGLGRLELTSNITYLLNFSEAQTPTSAPLNLLDTVSNPLRFRMRNGASWRGDTWGANLTLTYAGAYDDNISSPHRRVGSWTTADLVLTYNVDASHEGWLDGCTLALSVHNLFDTDPPFVNNPAGVGYDRENADLLNRFVSLRATKNW